MFNNKHFLDNVKEISRNPCEKYLFKKMIGYFQFLSQRQQSIKLLTIRNLCLAFYKVVHYKGENSHPTLF